MFVRIWIGVVLALFGCPVFAADVPPPGIMTANSRYVFMPQMDDGGRSSGPHAVTVCLPAGYDSTDRRYPVFYILDGESAFLTRQNGMRDTIAYELVHDQLVHEGLIEPVIFIAIHNSLDSDGKRIPGNRNTDYCMDGQTFKQGDIEKISSSKSEGYYQFLSQTVKPMIDKTYRTRPEPASTGVTGFSAGGAGAFWMTYLHPETFGMGICQSPPFFPPWVGKELSEIIFNPKLPVPNVRLWIDAGSREFDFIYKHAYSAYRKLLARGFRQNENIAFYTGHNHGHEKFDCTRRLRAALYFMLGTKTPKLTSVEIAEMDSEAGGPINLARRGHAILETVYDDWLRLTDCAAEFEIANPKVVALDSTTNEIRPRSAGSTTIASSYEGRKIVQQIEVPAPKAQQPCHAVEKTVTIDGDLSDWPNLPILVDKPQSVADATMWKGPADLSYRFDCRYDDNFFYIAIQVTDEHINSAADKDPWFQDGAEVRIDARPEADRLFGQGKEFQDFLLIAMSPSGAGETRLPFNAAKLPAGVKAVCISTATGYNAEIAIPISYINEKAGKQWSGIRLNVVVNDLDDDYKGFRGDKLWWLPDWRTPDSTWGAGTFVKE
ncbi:MAG: alpha/beta hydrolase-fold protein [Victivallales bacterium]|jgi:predicted alpha/beta superfamily hydrolase